MQLSVTVYSEVSWTTRVSWIPLINSLFLIATGMPCVGVVKLVKLFVNITFIVILLVQII
jgi:hypothetical protein